MPNILLPIGKGIVADAKDVETFFEKLGSDVKAAVSPQGLLALAVLAGVVMPVITEGAVAVSADGLNFTADVTEAELLIKLAPALKTYFSTLALQSAKGNNP